MKFKICKHCGNIITMIKDSRVPVMCCGEKMVELEAGTTDASLEKHVPVYNKEDNKVYVSVGSVDHPMVEEHYIEWIVLETNKGIQKKDLKPNEKPQAVFMVLDDEEVLNVYEYCNLHGLWKVSK